MEEEDETRTSSFHIKLSGLPQGTTVKDIREYFSNECDCGGVKKVTFLSENDAVTEVIVTDIDEFLKKGHCIKETSVKVTLENEAERTETQTDIIEVTGDDDIETLKLYFEGRRSGGNRSKAVEYVTKVDANVVHVKFKSTDDAAAVIAQERHLIAGTALNVYYAPVPASRRYKGDKLIIQNIPKGTEQKKLIVFIEAKLDIEFEEEFKLEMHNQVAIMSLQSSYNDEELQEMAETLASQQIAGQHLTVNLCEINHSIIVSGISNKNFIGNDDALQSYFESGRSGGGENTVKLLTPTKSKITFKDPSVIPEVLKKKHEKLGSSIVTEACSVFDALNESSEYKEEKESDDEGEDSFVLLKKSPNRKFSETDGASAHQPSIILDSPVQEPSPILDPPVYHPLKLDPLLLKYVRLKCTHLLKSVAQEFNVSIAFNDDTLAISPAMSSPPEWQTKSIEMINDIISNSLTKHTMSVPSQAAAAVYPVVMKCCSEEGLEYDFGQKGSNEFSIAGDAASVSKVKGDVEEIVNRIVREEEELKVDARDNYVYLKEYMFPIMQAKHPSLVLQCNDSCLTVSVAGSVNDVGEFKASFNHYLAHKQLSVDLCSEAVTFLQGESGKQVLQNLTKDAAVVPYFTYRDNDPCLLLLCPHEHFRQAENIAVAIAQNLDVSPFEVGWEYKTQVTSTEVSKFDTIVANLAEKYAFNVIVHDGSIKIVCTAQEKPGIFQELTNLIKEHFVPVPRNTLTQPLDPLIATYICINEKDSLESIAKELQVNIAFSDEKTITISPTMSSPPDWQTQSVAKMEDVIFSSVTKDSVSIPCEAAGAVYPLVMKFCNEQHLQYDFGEGGNELSIAGRTHFVTRLKSNVEEMSNRIVKKSDELEVESPEDYIYLKEYMFPLMTEKHPSLILQCNDNRLTISVSGSVKDVKEFKDIYIQYLSHQKISVNLSSEAVKFLRGDSSGQKVLHSIIGKSKIVLYFTTDGTNHYLHLLCPEELASQAETVAASIEEAVATESCKIPQSFHDQVDVEEYAQYKYRLAEIYAFTSIINGNELTVVSTTTNIHEVIQKLASFIAEACTLFETIKFKRGEWRLFEAALKVEWNEVKKEMEIKGISIENSSKLEALKPYICIKGETEAVQLVKKKIVALQKAIKSKKIIFSHAGICPYFLSNPNGIYIVKGVEKDAEVCIEVEVKEPSSNVFKEVFTGVTNEMMAVSVVVGDITEFNEAEVIVNAANEELKHRGGVAAAIAKKGGPIIQQMSDEYIGRHKKVLTGTAVRFDTTGNLPYSYKAIVHAVGPIYQADDKQHATASLKQAVYSSLKLARDCESIAIPAISAGTYGFPISACATVHFKAVVDFSKAEAQAKLRKVYFVIMEENAEVFKQAAENHLTPTQDTATGVESKFSEVPIFQSLRPVATPQSHLQSSVISSLPPTQTPAAFKGAQKKRKTKAKQKTEAIDYDCIKITNGDITEFQEEALVNTTDDKLKLTGLVSKKLLEKAGPGLQKECDGLTKPIGIGSVVTTGAHNLKKSKHILHVVLPNYDEKSEQILRKVVLKCLEECTRLKVKTLSMPSIGAGNLKYPHSVVAKALIEETASYFQKNQGRTTLALVHFVIFDKSIFDEFQRVLQAKRDTTLSRMPIVVTKGDIIDNQEEAIVHTNDRNLELKWAVGQLLAKKAGAELKKECDSFKRPVEFGHVISTQGYNLRAKYIIHAILHSYDKTSSEDPEKVLRNIVVKCLNECNRLKIKRLSMTSMGAGNLKYPAGIVARALVEETAAYLKNNQGKTTLELVHFVIYEQSIYDEFIKVYQHIASSTTPRKQKCFVLSQDLQLELVEGEIGNDNSDVTVTYDEAASQVEKKPVMTFVQNVGGFRRKMTLPVTFQQSSQEQKRFSLACLDMADKQQFDSIVFPTGSRGHTMQIAPKALVEASLKFVANNPKHVKVIRVLYATLSNEIVQQYEEALRSQMNGQENSLRSIAKALGSAVASVVGHSQESRPYFDDTPALESEVVLTIFGKTDLSVLNAEQKIKQAVDANFVIKKIENVTTAAFLSNNVSKLVSFAATHNVKIDIDSESRSVTLHGFQENVLNVHTYVQDVIHKISEEEKKTALANSLFKTIRWVRIPSQEEGEPYEEQLNYEIEQAFQAHKDTFYSDEHNFFIYFHEMKEEDKITHKTAEVIRMDLTTDFMPETWSIMPMTQERDKVFHLVPLPSSSSEYVMVERAFTMTMTIGKLFTEIVSIERLQNQGLYQEYAIRKKEMDKRNPNGQNERWLWHGTSPDTIEKINTHGFNRSFAGKNATRYGKGVYFARDASYSHFYAKPPDANGQRHMYYVQVLTGEYTIGSESMIVPPLKSSQGNLQYDSTVDNTANPTIFVVYHDPQNYPAYVVNYR